MVPLGNLIYFTNNLKKQTKTNDLLKKKRSFPYKMFCKITSFRVLSLLKICRHFETSRGYNITWCAN